MPYGSDYKYTELSRTARVIDAGGGVYSPSSWTGVRSALEKSWTRSGSNNNVPFPPGGSSGLFYRYVPSYRTVYVREAYDYTDSRGRKRVRYRKVPVLFPALKRIRNQRPSANALKSLRPNSLSAYFDKIERSGTVSLVGTNTAWGSRIEFTGHVTDGYSPQWGTANNSDIPFSAVMPLVAPGSGIDVDRLADEALGKLRSAVKGQSLNLAQFIAERQQTVDLIADAGIRLARALLAARKGRIVDAIKIMVPNTPKRVANDWLAFQYGVRPLISDMEAAIGMLTAGASLPLEFDVVASASREEPIERFMDQSTPNKAGLRWAFKSELSGKHRVVVKYKARLRLKQAFLHRATSLGFTNPAHLSWELIPFSFVADWFIPVGDYLNGLDAFEGVEVVWITKTVYMKSSFESTTTFGGTDANNVKWSSDTSTWRRNTISVSRSILNPNVIPKPALHFEENPLSTTRIANAIALLMQLRK